MKKAIVLVALLSAFLTSHLANAEEAAVNSIAPAFELNDAAGKSFKLSSLRGKVVYLDFWASWCPPCLISLPWMNELQRRFPADRFQIVAVNVDEQDKDAEKVIKKLKPEFLVLKDPKGTVPQLYNIITMPTSFLIKPDGTIAVVHSGFRSSDKQELEEKITELLKVK